jgi:hypothetical protein
MIEMPNCTRLTTRAVPRETTQREAIGLAALQLLTPVLSTQMLWGGGDEIAINRQIINRAMAPSAPMSTWPMEPIRAQAAAAEANERPEPFPYTVRS